MNAPTITMAMLLSVLLLLSSLVSKDDCFYVCVCASICYVTTARRPCANVAIERPQNYYLVKYEPRYALSFSLHTSLVERTHSPERLRYRFFFSLNGFGFGSTRALRLAPASYILAYPWVIYSYKIYQRLRIKTK